MPHAKIKGRTPTVNDNINTAELGLFLYKKDSYLPELSFTGSGAEKPAVAINVYTIINPWKSDEAQELEARRAANLHLARRIKMGLQWVQVMLDTGLITLEQIDASEPIKYTTNK